MEQAALADDEGGAVRLRAGEVRAVAIAGEDVFSSTSMPRRASLAATSRRVRWRCW